MKVAIIDSGIDLFKLYDAERHGYVAEWIAVESLSYDVIEQCDLVIIPAGTDNTLLYLQRVALQLFLARGGWIYCFDGPVPGLLEGVVWEHTTTRHKVQNFIASSEDYAFLLDRVSLEGLACKDGIRGWWCEGELSGSRLVPLISDMDTRVVAALLPSSQGSGVMVITAAGRLPTFSNDSSLAPNRLFSNLLAYCAAARTRQAPPSAPLHLYVHSGNWAHRSFLESEKFGSQFQGVHWSCLDEGVLSEATSIWIPWESNTRALKQCWPVFERAVNAGATLVIEDLRDNWLSGVRWHSRPVDSNWWREQRQLDLSIESPLSAVLPDLAERSCFWHYHGVFDGPSEEIVLLSASGGKNVLSLVGPTSTRKGRILLSTLDATFEFGVGKIKETADYISSMLKFVNAPTRSEAQAVRPSHQSLVDFL